MDRERKEAVALLAAVMLAFVLLAAWGGRAGERVESPASAATGEQPPAGAIIQYEAPIPAAKAAPATPVTPPGDRAAAAPAAAKVEPQPPPALKDSRPWPQAVEDKARLYMAIYSFPYQLGRVEYADRGFYLVEFITRPGRESRLYLWVHKDRPGASLALPLGQGVLDRCLDGCARFLCVWEGESRPAFPYYRLARPEEGLMDSEPYYLVPGSGRFTVSQVGLAYTLERVGPAPAAIDLIFRVVKAEPLPKDDSIRPPFAEITESRSQVAFRFQGVTAPDLSGLLEFKSPHARLVKAEAAKGGLELTLDVAGRYSYQTLTGVVGLKPGPDLTGVQILLAPRQ